MNKPTEETAHDLSELVEQGKELAGHVRDKATRGLKATHQAVQENPYKAIGIALGVGAIIGFLLARRSPRED
jgi:ElaB/YqjD/DUF883 family membrane-anchored ribosome-binding protein